MGLAHAAGIGANYEIIVSQNGNAFVLATFSGEGTLDVSFPSDVTSPYVKGALYTKSGNSITLSLTGDRMATVSYRTSALTQKTGKAWGLSLPLPENLTNAYVSVALPKSVSISKLTPSDGIVMSEEDSIVVAWASGAGLGGVSLEYEFAQTTEPPIQTQQPAFDWNTIGMLVLAVAAVIALVALAVWVYPRLKTEQKKSAGAGFCITEGMRNVLKALNENDVKVVEELANAGGEMRRSELERKSGIAKSSLALSLDRLEEKGILKIDKQTTTHRVSLTEWFRSL
ncbi:MAG: hypothetical protein AB1468_00535 [Candidatus Micrarchaeota archaeon]